MESINNRKQNLILALIGIGLILIAIIAFFVLSQDRKKSDTEILLSSPVDVHFPAPDVRLTDLQGHPVALADYKGQVILYNAWATWCPPCKQEMPMLEAYYQAHRQDGFVVIAIEDGEPVADVAAYVKEIGLTFPVWPDLKSVATQTFGINTLPMSYVLDRNGVVRLKWYSAITPELLEQYVTPLLKE